MGASFGFAGYHAHRPNSSKQVPSKGMEQKCWIGSEVDATKILKKDKSVFIEFKGGRDMNSVQG